VNLATTAPSDIKPQAVSRYLISCHRLEAEQQACLTQALESMLTGEAYTLLRLSLPTRTPSYTSLTMRYDRRMETAEHFGAVLAEHRRNAGFSQSRLARMSGLSRGTIANIEAGRTLPAKDTRQRLLRVKQLALPTGQSEETPTTTPTSWITRLYSPLDMSREMERLLNGPGGTLEQTYSYVDPQSARDWYDYANLPEYVAQFRNQFPAKELASTTLGRDTHRAIDLVALGVGDGICANRHPHGASDRQDHGAKGRHRETVRVYTNGSDRREAGSEDSGRGPTACGGPCEGADGSRRTPLGGRRSGRG